MSSTPYEYPGDRAGSEPAETTSVTIASGQKLVALVPLGQVTASGKFVECDPTATDGSQKAVRLTAYAVDASGGDKQAQVYKAGNFDIDQVQWHANFDPAKKAAAFVGTPISVQSKLAGL